MYKLVRNTDNHFCIYADSLYDIYAYLSPKVDKSQDYYSETLDIAGHKGGISVAAILDRAKSTMMCVATLLHSQELKGKYTLYEL